MPQTSKTGDLVFAALAKSNPSDTTGFYMMTRAFQAHMRGDEKRAQVCLKIALKEHLSSKKETK